MTTTTITHVTIDEALADYLDKQFKDLKDDKDDKDKEDEDRLFMLGEPSWHSQYFSVCASCIR